MEELMRAALRHNAGYSGAGPRTKANPRLPGKPEALPAPVILFGGMVEDTTSLLNWCKDTVGVRARHPKNPAQANTRVGHVNQALLWERSLGERGQPSEFSHYARQDVRRRGGHVMPIVPDFISDGRPSADRRSNGQLRGVVLLGLKQNQKSESFDG